MSDITVVSTPVIVEVSPQVYTVTVSSVGAQGAKGDKGDKGDTGSSGVIAVTAPITNTGTSTSANIGINAGVANGVATLDGSGLIPTSQLPPLAISDTFVVASQAAMLALTAQVGDVAVRTDINQTFILQASPPTTLANWVQILTPPAITSITASSPLTGGTITSTGTIGISDASTTVKGAVQLTDSTSSTSTTTAATPNSVKTAYDLANGKASLATANTFTTGTQTIQTGSDTNVGLKVSRNSATQSADIVQVTQSDGTTILAKVAANGAITTASGLTASGAITTSSNISTTGGGSITSATNVTAAGFVSTGTTNVTLGTSGATGGNLVFATTGGTQSLIAATGATGSQTLPATAGTILNSATTSIPNVTTANGLTSASSLATVGTITSGTWNATAIDPSKGGTGSTYGSLMVGHSQLNADVTKNANDTTPESVFRTGTAFSSIQYFNVDANTTYFFEGTIRLLKTATGSVVNNSMLYYATGGTTPLTEQSSFMSVSYYVTTAGIGFGSASATATAASSSSTTGTSIVCVFRGQITTHASTAGRFNIASWLTTAGASAPNFLAGSYINLYKVGTGSVQTFGNWS
jgi:hypothetical protein